MKLTIRELMDNYDWDKVCKVLGLNPWCINEGLATGDEEEEITDEQARQIGILLPDNSLIRVCKQLILHRHQGNLHPIDYQRIEQALAKIEGK